MPARGGGGESMGGFPWGLSRAALCVTMCVEGSHVNVYSCARAGER